MAAWSRDLSLYTENISGLKNHDTVMRLRSLVPDVDNYVEEAHRRLRDLPRVELSTLLPEALSSLRSNVTNEIYQQVSAALLGPAWTTATGDVWRSVGRLDGPGLTLSTSGVLEFLPCRSVMFQFRVLSQNPVFLL